MRKNNYLIYLLSFFLLLTFSISSFAATYYSRVSGGNWNSNASWSTTSCGGASATSFPSSTDSVVICSGVNIVANVNSNCHGMTLQGTGHLTVSSGVTLTLGGNLTIDGTTSYIIGLSSTTSLLNIGGSLNVTSNHTTNGLESLMLTVSGSTVVNGYLDVCMGASAGSYSFNGDVTVNSIGNFHISSARPFTFGGNIANNAAVANFSTSSSAVALSGTGKSLNGNLSFASVVTITGSYTNNGTFSTTDGTNDITGSGSLTQAANSTLNVGGSTSGLAVLNASASGNTVNYTSSLYGRIAKAATYYDLNFITSGCTYFLSGSTIVNDNLSLSTGVNLASNISSPTSAFTHTVSGLTTLNGTATLYTNYASDVFNLQNVSMNGGALGVNGGATGTINVAGTFSDVVGTTTTLSVGTMNFKGASTINGTITFNGGFASGTKTFAGLLTIGSAGNWSYSLSSVGTPIFQNGITVNNGGIFSHLAPVTFNTNNQSLSGVLTFGEGITVAGITVTNYGTVNLSQLYNGSNLLSGTGSWIQGNGSTLNIGGNINIASFNAYTSGQTNTVNYNANGSFNQNIFTTPYSYLTLSGTSNPTYSKGFVGNTTVNNDLTVSGGAVCTVSGLACCGTNGSGYTQNVLGTTLISMGSTITYNSWNHSCILNTKNLVMNGATINNTLSNSATNQLNVSNNFSVTYTSNTIDKLLLTVTDSSSINGSGTILNLTTTLASSANFSGIVSVGLGATFSMSGYTSAAGNGTCTFKNGLSVDGTFSGTRCYFTTNAQSLNYIASAGSISFSDNVIVTGINLTNNHSNVSMTSTSAGVLQGSGTWTQGSNPNPGTLHYAGSSITVSTFSASGLGNTVDLNASAAQTIFNPAANTYFNLTLSNSAKTLSGSLIVNGDLTLNTGSILNASPTNQYSVSIKGSMLENGGSEVNINQQEIIFNPTQ